MKKILTHLTGIVFIITILIAAGCGDRSKENGVPRVAKEDPTKVDIYLKDSVINDTVHLFMFNEKKPECGGVIDDHLVVAKRGYTVRWRNAQKSEIDKIKHIRPVGDTAFFGAVPEVETTGIDTTEFFSLNKGVLKLVIPDSASLDTLIKYEIVFTVKYHKDSILTIDPYLKVPKQK